MRDAIAAALTTEGQTVKELAVLIGNSESTIRRHLNAMAKQGQAESYKRGRANAWKLSNDQQMTVKCEPTTKPDKPAVIETPLVKGGQGRPDILPSEVRVTEPPSAAKVAALAAITIPAIVLGAAVLGLMAWGIAAKAAISVIA